ncbi:hypothetical protein O5833_29610, partial [Escherichia coli]|nr:hypothetical protein [Escherichia coli]
APSGKPWWHGAWLRAGGFATAASALSQQASGNHDIVAIWIFWLPPTLPRVVCIFRLEKRGMLPDNCILTHWGWIVGW